MEIAPFPETINFPHLGEAHFPILSDDKIEPDGYTELTHIFKGEA